MQRFPMVERTREIPNCNKSIPPFHETVRSEEPNTVFFIEREPIATSPRPEDLREGEWSSGYDKYSPDEDRKSPHGGIKGPRSRSRHKFHQTLSQPVVNHGSSSKCAKKNQRMSGRQQSPGPRKDHGVDPIRLKANPLRCLATRLHSKIIDNPEFSSVYQLAEEVHLETKAKYSSTLRRTYDVMNVLEGADLLEKIKCSTISPPTGQRKATKSDDQIQGTLVKWRDPSLAESEKKKAELRIIRERISQKNQRLNKLEEEMELVEKLINHNKIKHAPATSVHTPSMPTQQNIFRRISDQPLSSSTMEMGIRIPFAILDLQDKEQTLSKPASVEVKSYTDLSGFCTHISSDYDIQPCEWKRILLNLLETSGSSLVTYPEAQIHGLLYIDKSDSPFYARLDEKNDGTLDGDESWLSFLAVFDDQKDENLNINPSGSNLSPIDDRH